MLEYRERVTSQADVANDTSWVSAALREKADVKTLNNAVATLNSAIEDKVSLIGLADYIANITKIVNSLQSQLCAQSVSSITDSGYVNIASINSCPSYNGAIRDGRMPPSPKRNTKQIRVTLRSDFDQLKQQVNNLSARIAQLEATTKITPILDTSLRREYNYLSKKLGIILYPKYGDWILTSDTDTLQLSFAGLRAEIGRSIYIQTRKSVYLLANGDSFYGLDSKSNSVSVNQWLSNNTTYRFVRAGATDWLVTASSSPYPWT